MNKKKGITLLLTALFFTIMPDIANSQKIMSIVKSHSNLSSFAKALEANKLDEKLDGKGPFTIFAPVNDIFDKEISGKSLTSTSVKNLLLNHIMTGYATERNMKVMSKATTLGGVTLALNTGGKAVKINTAEVIEMNIKARNGVLHIINGILK
jgi:uncharacterized surface protein with fasciclin (FAS1) repeats